MIFEIRGKTLKETILKLSNELGKGGKLGRSTEIRVRGRKINKVLANYFRRLVSWLKSGISFKITSVDIIPVRGKWLLIARANTGKGKRLKVKLKVMEISEKEEEWKIKLYLNT